MASPEMKQKDLKKLREIYEQWREVHCIEEDNFDQWIDNHTKHRIAKEVMGDVVR